VATLAFILEDWNHILIKGRRGRRPRFLIGSPNPRSRRKQQPSRESRRHHTSAHSIPCSRTHRFTVSPSRSQSQNRPTL
jgi:hypothetical protein